MKKTFKVLYKFSWMSFYFFKCYLSTAIFKILLLCNNAKYGKNIKSNNGITALRISITAKSFIIGDNVVFNNYNDAGWYSKCMVWIMSNASVIIGSNVGLNGVFIYSSSGVNIGNNVCIGGGTRIFDTDFHPLNFLDRRNGRSGTVSKEVIIDDDVFIGTNCIIGKGVHIGARSIIAAGSVLVKSVPSDEIWGGNPAKFIRNIDNNN